MVCNSNEQYEAKKLKNEVEIKKNNRRIDGISSRNN